MCVCVWWKRGKTFFDHPDGNKYVINGTSGLAHDITSHCSPIQSVNRWLDENIICLNNWINVLLKMIGYGEIEAGARRAHLDCAIGTVSLLSQVLVDYDLKLLEY